MALAKTDKAAFGELYERYLGKIYSYVYYRTGNAHDAEDLTAKVFFRALSHISNYVETRARPFRLGSIASRITWWRIGIAIRRGGKSSRWMSMWRTRCKSDAPDRMAEEKEEKRPSAGSGAAVCPHDRQQLLLLKFVEQMSNAEIGAIMGRTEGAVKSLYHRTLLALRDEMDPVQHGRAEPATGWRRGLKRKMSKAADIQIGDALDAAAARLQADDGGEPPSGASRRVARANRRKLSPRSFSRFKASLTAAESPDQAFADRLRFELLDGAPGYVGRLRQMPGAAVGRGYPGGYRRLRRCLCCAASSARGRLPISRKKRWLRRCSRSPIAIASRTEARSPLPRRAPPVRWTREGCYTVAGLSNPGIA